MTIRRLLHTIALFAAVCIALTSVASAARLAPMPALTAEMQAFLAAGGSVDALCGDHDVDHDDHDCPFCRLLSDPESIAPFSASWILIPQRDGQTLTDLTAHHQLYQLAISARGPPCQG